MELPSWLESRLMQICDSIFAIVPQKAPTLENLSKCKIISHRGQHDNITVYENTLSAFDHALETEGIWGIELDFRWTKDLHPVVAHDPDLLRLFGSNLRISEKTLAELKQHCPQVPTLEEVLLRYGGKLHLMVRPKKNIILNRKSRTGFSKSSSLHWNLGKIFIYFLLFRKCSCWLILSTVQRNFR